MKRPLIDISICKKCNPCNIEIFCPAKAIIREEITDPAWVDFNKCTGCMNAIEVLIQPCTLKLRKSR